MFFISIIITTSTTTAITVTTLYYYYFTIIIVVVIIFIITDIISIIMIIISEEKSVNVQVFAWKPRHWPTLPFTKFSGKFSLAFSSLYATTWTFRSETQINTCCMSCGIRNPYANSPDIDKCAAPVSFHHYTAFLEMIKNVSSWKKRNVNILSPFLGANHPNRILWYVIVLWQHM